MKEKNISIVKAFSYGFKKTFEHFWLLLRVELLLVVCIWIIKFFAVIRLAGADMVEEDRLDAFLKALNVKILSLLPSGVQTFLTQFAPFLWIFSFCILIGLYFGWCRVILDIYDTNSSSIKRLFSQFPRFFTCFAALFLYRVMVGVGLSLLVIPGVILAAKHGMYFYALVGDSSLGPIQSLKKSNRLTKGVVEALFFYDLLWMLLLFLSLLSVIGWIIMFPVLYLTHVHIYRQLTEQTNLNSSHE